MEKWLDVSPHDKAGQSSVPSFHTIYIGGDKAEEEIDMFSSNCKTHAFAKRKTQPIAENISYVKIFVEVVLAREIHNPVET